MRESTITIAIAFTMTALGCTGEIAGPEDVDDHVLSKRTFEGTALDDLFGATGESAPLRVDDGFRRVGLLWDATGEGALELRTSDDGTVWSAWRAPELVSVEEIAHAGHVDAFDTAGAGSADDDPMARFIQVRVPAGAPRPSFLVIDPLRGWAG